MVVVVAPDAVGRDDRGARTRTASSLAGRRGRGRPPSSAGHATWRARSGDRGPPGRIAVGVSGGGLEPARAGRRRGPRRARRRRSPSCSRTARARPSTGRRSRGSTRRSSRGGDDDRRCAEDDAWRTLVAPVDLVVLAGYMRIVGPGGRWRRSRTGSSTPTRRCCPAFPGAHAVRDALAHGVAVTGVHGPPRGRDARRRADRRPGGRAGPARRRRDDASTSGSAPVEHRLLPRAVALAAGRRARPSHPARARSRWTSARAEAALPDPAPGAPVGQRQDGPRRPRARPGRPRLRARVAPAGPPGRCARPASRSPTSRP